MNRAGKTALKRDLLPHLTQSEEALMYDASGSQLRLLVNAIVDRLFPEPEYLHDLHRFADDGGPAVD